MAESLKDKIVFVTGASAGIGKSCAEKFAAEGAKLILAARRIERLKELANKLKQKKEKNERRKIRGVRRSKCW